MTLFRIAITLEAHDLSEAWESLAGLPTSFAPDTLDDWADVHDFKISEVDGPKSISGVFQTAAAKPLTAPIKREGF